MLTPHEEYALLQRLVREYETPTDGAKLICAALLYDLPEERRAQVERVIAEWVFEYGASEARLAASEI